MEDLRRVRPVLLEINTDNLIHNYGEIRRIVNPSTLIMAVIKANGYGHGSIELARLYEKIGVDRLAVSVVTEAVELRKAGIKLPIHILSYTPEGQLDLIIENEIVQGIYSYNDAKLLSDLASKLGRVPKIHIKIDSGMGRIGFLPNDDSIEEIIKISKLPNLEIEGLFTHFAKADEKDKSFTRKQFELFTWVSNKLVENGIEVKIKHASNSAAIIDLPEYNLDMVRPGIILYGYYPSDEVDMKKIHIRPAMTLKAKISNIKKVAKDTGISYGHLYYTKDESKIATLPIGYADGYSRMLTGKGLVWIKGKKVPIVGKICMDQMMIDVTDLDDVKIGDEVVLFGYENDSYPRVEELANLLGTINYEFLCMMGRRIPRIYFKDNSVIAIRDYLLG